jgi:DNA-binding transcriptional LysR family regulator
MLRQPMELAQQVQRIWPWIPVFRVVAETEHLPTAAQRLHISPSALSRTVRLIEVTLGQELFIRTARRIVLNRAGQRLLEAVRRSMLSLERAMQQVPESSFSGSYRVSSLGVLTDYVVLPALLLMREHHPALVPAMTTLTSREANRQLASGLIEVAFYYDATTMEGIVCRRIGAHTNSIYCGRGHALFGKRKILRQRLLEHEFSVAAIGDRGTPMDSWPVEVPRRIGFQILMLSTNLTVALSGRFLTVLPDVVADAHARDGRLWRLDSQIVPNTDVFAACRAEDVESSFTAEVIRACEERLASAPARGGSRPRSRRRAGRA